MFGEALSCIALLSIFFVPAAIVLHHMGDAVGEDR